MHVCLLEGNLLSCPYNNRNDFYVFRAPSFYLPTDPTTSIILVGPGTGIAPFVSFWQQRKAQAAAKTKLGKCWLFFGCRQRELDLYQDEKEQLVKDGIMDRNFLALSREPGIPKVVQNLKCCNA